MNSPKKRRLHTNFSKDETVSSIAANDAVKRWRKLELAFGAMVSCFIVLSVFCAPEGNIREGDYLPVVLVFLLFVTGFALWTYRLCIQSAKIDESSLLETEALSDKPFRFVWLADAFLGVFLLGATLSYLRVVFGHTGEVRLSTNAYWTFITPVLFYFLLRVYRNFCTKPLILGLCALTFACAISESAYSVYSYAVTNPRLREAYLANPDKMLREANLSFAPNSRERLLFEKRLLESSEPTGTYGLANTLAGFLAPVFILGLAGFVHAIMAIKKHKSVQNQSKLSLSTLLLLAVWLVGLGLIIVVIILTKSRAGFLAAAFGVSLIALYYLTKAISLGNKRTKRVVAFGLGTIVLMVLMLGGALALGVIDREVFTEAGKSLAYRMDYWRATYDMILDNPVLGVGPGEFQSVYPRYILPTASEFIADPHNFAFEISALFGLPAFAALAFFILSVWGIVLLGTRLAKDELNCEESSDDLDNSWQKTLKNVALGGGIGLVFLFFISFFQDTPVEGIFIGWAAVAIGITIPAFGFLGKGLTKSTSDLSVAGAIAMATLLLNICAAGGIGYPVISTLLFMLAAFSVNLNDKRISNSVKGHTFTSKRTSLSVLVVSIVLLCVFYVSAFKPRCNSFLFSLLYNPQSNVTSEYQEDLKNGSVEKIDGSSSAVVTQFYYFSALEYADSPSNTNLERWQGLRERVKYVAPNSASVRENCGDFDFGLYIRRNKRNKAFLDSAIDFYQDAVAFSPTEVGKRVKLYRAYLEKELVNEALKEAEKALYFNEITHHEDRKLQDDVREELKAFVQKASVL